MDRKGKSQQHMVMDQSLLVTPKPRACSTNKKQRIIRSNVSASNNSSDTNNQASSSRDSLGILSLNDVDLTPTLGPRTIIPNQDNFNTISQQLQRQRNLAEGLLAGSGRAGLPSMYLKSMVKSERKKRTGSESTIDDSDFLSNMSTRSSFCPNNISTPRSSTANVDLEGSIFSGLDIAGNISLMADQIMNTDISIKDLCKQYESLLKTDESAINDTFLSSADEAAKMLQQDEQAWRQENDTIPQVAHDSIFSNMRESLIMDRSQPSMGEFFQVKSDKCSSIFNKRSPEKDAEPAALVSNSTMIDESSRNIRSFNISTANNPDEIKSPTDYNVSEIVRLFSNESLSTAHLVECLVNKNCKMKPEQVTRNSLAPSSIKQASAERKVELATMQLPLSLPKSLSPKGNVFVKVDYADTFASDKLLTISCKSSLEDLSDKENSASVRNVSPCNNPRCTSANGSPNRSLASIRSGSSLDYLIDGRVPVATTKVELVWTTVKVGKSSKKDFVLRNKIHQKIRFQMVVTGSCFKITNPEGESQTPISVLLHPLESRSFTVTFTPMSIGAYSDRIIIQSATKASDQSNKPAQKILLFGYGGHVSLDMRNLLKDSTGKYWLPLGHIDEIQSDTLNKSFEITNAGTLASFVDLTVNLKYLQVFAGLKITPNIVVIPAGNTQHFQVDYMPNKDDFRRLKYGGQFTSNVCEVVQIKCLFGAEVLRGRIRRLAAKLDGKIDPSDSLISRIVESFPGESIPSDIRLICESISSLKYLVQHLDSKEIVVTVEQDTENTITPNHHDSSTFQTLYFDTNDVTCIEQAPNLFDVHPKALVLSPKLKRSDIVFVVNNSDEIIKFQARLSKDLVYLSTQSGEVSPLNTSMIKITCKDDINLHTNQSLKLTVLIDDSCFEVDIQIMCLNAPS